MRHVHRTPTLWTCPLIPYQVKRADIPERQLTLGHQALRALTLAESYLRMTKRAAMKPDMAVKFRRIAFQELRTAERILSKCSV